jgi:hypothetical protein
MVAATIRALQLAVVVESTVSSRDPRGRPSDGERALNGTKVNNKSNETGTLVLVLPVRDHSA